MKKMVLIPLAVLVVLAVAVGAWLLNDDGSVEKAGSCEGMAYALEADRDGDVVEVSYELQDTAPAETWQVVVEHGGEKVLDGERQTDEDGEVDADAFLPRDADGEVTATATKGDLTCTASVSLG